MASNGSFLTSGWHNSGNDATACLKFSWSVQSTSVADNTTTIKWELRGQYIDGYYVNAGGFKVVIDGATVYDKSTDYRIKLYNGTLVASGTKTLSHDSTGKKSFSASAQGGVYYYDVNCKGSGSWELPTIPRQATITSAPDFTDEEKPTIKYTNAAGTAVTTLQACISLDGSKADVAYRDISKTGTSYTFNLTDAERNVLRNATTTSNTRTVRFMVKTIVGGVTFTSSQTKTLTIVNANPTFTDSQISYADATTAVVAITGNNQHIVQNKSSLTATIKSAATGKKGATISQYTLAVNGVTKTATAIGDVGFGAVNSSKNVTLSVTAKDSRGNTTTVNKTITIFAWSAPVVNATVERLNNYEDTTYLTADASVSSVNGKNTMKVTYKVKQNGGSYGSAVTIDNKKTYTLTRDKNHAHTFSITVTDAFTSVTKEFPLAKGKFPMFIDTEKNAVGINEFPSEGEALRVAGGVACFDDGIVLKSGSKSFKITISDSGALNIVQM